MIWETGVQLKVKSYQRLGAALFSTQHYKVRIKQSLE